jgi:UPF0755 protein
MMSLSKKGATILIVLLVATVFFVWFFGSPQPKGGTIRLVIPLYERDSLNYAADYLAKEKAIRNKSTFLLVSSLYGLTSISPGAYVMESGKSLFGLVSKLKGPPNERWIVIPEGWRKEEIGEMLAASLNWSDSEMARWLSYASPSSDYFEGVYFPDTYLIPERETPERIAQRMINRFNEQFAPYAQEFLKRNIKWTTGLKIASLVQREAANKDDMPLIAGIIWNRLFNKMKLEVDATLQYARGNVGNGWWAPLTREDKKRDSPYNTYLYQGLPPHPIANPGKEAIEAALYPAKTDCLFYLHDAGGRIHCAKTYEEHLANIAKYLNQ